MRYKIFIFLYLIFCGCATVSYRRLPQDVIVSKFLTLEEFCRKYNFQYNFDFSDDTLRLFSHQGELKFILGIPIFYLNGEVFDLKFPPFYYKGKIFIPKEIEKFLNYVIPKIPIPFKIKTIVIDPGHGGRDPGAISRSGLKEKNLNLIIAKYIKEELERNNFNVILTRYEDKYLSLEERTNIAKNYKADFFVSIHANSNYRRRERGVEIYYTAPFISKEHFRKLLKNEDLDKENLSLEEKLNRCKNLIYNNSAFSLEVAKALYDNFKDMGFIVKPPKKASFFVLKNAYVPSILVEVGYISNPFEERFLRRPNYQRQLAEAIATGIIYVDKNYYNSSFANKNEK